MLASGPAFGQEADETDADEAADEAEADSADEEADEEADEAADEPTEPEPAPEPAPAPEPEPEPEPEPAPAPVGPVTTDGADRDVDLVEEESQGERLQTEGEVIELTGTLIRRQELTTAAPLTVLDKTDIDSTGLQSVGDVVQQLPSQVGGINTQFNNGGSGATRVDMRGLGAGRTLVLVNGRRHVPSGTGANASVDLNSIPMAVVERVEVLKDGASAIYGSDAIGGVVNIITRDDFEGTETTLFAGTPQRGSLNVFDASVVTGMNGDKGNVMFSAGYHNTGDMMADEREYSIIDRTFVWGNCEPNEQGLCTNEDGIEDGGPVATLGSSAVPNGVLVDYGEDVGNEAWERALDNNPSGAYVYDPNGGFRDANLGEIYYPSHGFEGDAYNYQPDNYLVTPQRRYNLFSTGRYDLHERVETFFEATHTNRRSDQLLAPEPLFTIVEDGISAVSGDNIYNPFGRDFIDVRRRLVETGFRTSAQDVNTSRVVLGLRGDLPEAGSLENWHWNVAYNFGRTNAISTKGGNLVLDRLQNAIGPSYVDDAGVARCGSPDNPGPEECVPMNLFGGEGSITNDMLDYVTYTGVAEGYNRQNSIQGNVSGKLLETPWDGDVSLAVGAEYRDLVGGFQPDPITASGNTTGNAGEPTHGGYNVGEGYAEISALPVVGKPMAEWLEIKAAARVFDYSTFDFDISDNITWETGVLWGIDRGVSLRSTLSTAFAAPGIGALFSGAADSFPLVTDPCSAHAGRRDDPVIDANCQADELSADFNDTRAQQRSQVGGNPDLTPETANIFTAGAVYEPDFVEGLAFTADYFNISVRNAISALGANTLLNACYGREDRGANIVPGTDACDRIIRDSQTGLLRVIEDPLTNLGDDGGVDTAGIDFAARYAYDTPGGRLGHSIEGTRLLKYDVRQTLLVEDPADGITHGRGVYDAGVRPTWRFNFNTRWGYDAFGAGTNIRYIGSIRECEADNCQSLFDSEEENAPHRRVSRSVTADLFGSYTFDASEFGLGRSRLSVGMNNVLDTDPPYVANGFTANSEPAAYDFLGRYFYARFTQSF